jgi:hypothetical protein
VIPLEQQILELEIRRAESELKGVLGIIDHVPNELEESEYLRHTPVNSGDDFLEVLALLWERRLETGLGPVANLEAARELASEHGFKGICITFV